MSTIDAYHHRLIGFIQCPMNHSLFGDGRVLKKPPVYELLRIDEGATISHRWPRAFRWRQMTNPQGPAS